MSDIIWEQYSHQYVWDTVQGGPGVGAAQNTVDSWGRAQQRLTEIDGTLAAALNSITGQWEGIAADATRTGLTPLGVWVADAAARASTGATSLVEQADQVAWVRNNLPPPPRQPTALDDQIFGPIPTSSTTEPWYAERQRACRAQRRTAPRPDGDRRGRRRRRSPDRGRGTGRTAAGGALAGGDGTGVGSGGTGAAARGTGTGGIGVGLPAAAGLGGAVGGIGAGVRPTGSGGAGAGGVGAPGPGAGSPGAGGLGAPGLGGGGLSGGTGTGSTGSTPGYGGAGGRATGYCTPLGERVPHGVPGPAEPLSWRSDPNITGRGPDATGRAPDVTEHAPTRSPLTGGGEEPHPTGNRGAAAGTGTGTGTGMMPRGAGTGGQHSQGRRRPGYLIDDSGAFVDDRWFTPPVVTPDDPLPPPPRR